MVKTVNEMIYREYECNKCFKIFFNGTYSRPLNFCPHCKSTDINQTGIKNYETKQETNEKMYIDLLIQLIDGLKLIIDGLKFIKNNF